MADPKPFSVEDIRKEIPDILDIKGNLTASFSRPAPAGQADAGSITFLRGGQVQEQISRSQASVILCSPEGVPDGYAGKAALVVVAEPRKAFIRLLSRIFPPPRPSGLHPKAIVSPEASIDPTAYVGPGAVIGRCVIGARTVIHANAVLYDGVRTGQGVTVHAGSVIGADGFGYERGEDGAMEKFIHLGGVLIEDDVEIGSNTSIDRGTLGDTIIRQGAKIDNQIHVAHNVDIGRDAVVIAQSMIGGSVRIGDRAWIAPSVTIMNGLTIGADAVCGLGAVVTKSVADGATVMGNPARNKDEAKALLAAQKKLIGS